MYCEMASQRGDTCVVRSGSPPNVSVTAVMRPGVERCRRNSPARDVGSATAESEITACKVKEIKLMEGVHAWLLVARYNFIDG